jgi:hypothetical protein
MPMKNRSTYILVRSHYMLCYVSDDTDKRKYPYFARLYYTWAYCYTALVIIQVKWHLIKYVHIETLVSHTKLVNQHRWRNHISPSFCMHISNISSACIWIDSYILVRSHYMLCYVSDDINKTKHPYFTRLCYTWHIATRC